MNSYTSTGGSADPFKSSAASSGFVGSFYSRFTNLWLRLRSGPTLLKLFAVVMRLFHPLKDSLRRLRRWQRQATATIVLALATLGNVTQIGLFLFMSWRPRWPRQGSDSHVLLLLSPVLSRNFRQWKYYLNSLVVTRNLWLILFSKNLVKHTSENFWSSKDSKYVCIFSLAIMVAELLTSLWFFTI